MKKTIFCVIITFLILSLMTQAAQKPDEPAFQTVKAETMNLNDTVTLHGTVVERERYEVFAGMPAKVFFCCVKEGDKVKKGQLLLSFEEGEDDIAVFSNEIKKALKGALSGELDLQSSGMLGTIKQNADGKYSLLSPCSGTVMKIASQKGEFVPSASPCAVISDTEKLGIDAQVDEDYIKYLSAGMKCKISVPALSDNETDGIIETISPCAKTTFSLNGSGEKKTDVRISVSSAELRPGYSATVSVITSTRENVLVLPYEAIGEDENNREYALVFNGKSTEKRFLECGKELDDFCEIVSGITPSDDVVLYPDERSKK